MRRALLLVLGVILFAQVVVAAAELHAGLEGLVVRVADGDTIGVRLGDHVEAVRYIGINTPELARNGREEQPGARRAHGVNRRLVEGRRVRLELDVQARDRYGRLLAYVWVADIMVNAELLRLGVAQVMTVPPNVRHRDQFRELERAAREAGRGLWALPPA
jgi:micrococcal nuclease